MALHIHEKGLLPSLEGAGLIVFHITAPYLRGWRRHWGATPEEMARKLPGDEVIPHPRWSYTHAVTVAAPPDAIWPWIVQLGDRRGGFYSYQSLENLAGCQLRNATAILPELQDLKVGDGIQLHNKVPALPVFYLQRNRGLVVGGPADASGMGATWGWFLKPDGHGGTRLIERWRTTYPLTTGARLGFGQLFTEPIGFVMSRKMLLGIKARAEALAIGGRQAQPA